MINQCTKFEVYRFTRYEAMNGGAKCRKWGGYRGTQGHGSFDRAHSTLIEKCVYLLPFSTYSQLFVESRRFSPTPPAFGVPIRVAPVKFRGDLWSQKTRVPWLSCSVVFVILCLAVLVEHRLVTDTDTDTGPWLVPRVHSIAR